MAVERCDTCGASCRPPGTAWCGQCHRSLTPPEVPPRHWRPLPPVEPALPPPVYSRWRGGVMSFGPLGRLLVTVLWLAVTVWLVRSSPLSGVVCLLAGPWLLRDVWKRARIR